MDNYLLMGECVEQNASSTGGLSAGIILQLQEILHWQYIDFVRLLLLPRQALALKGSTIIIRIIRINHKNPTKC